MSIGRLEADIWHDFLSGAVKEKYYADMPKTIEHLKANIHNAIAEIRCTKISPIEWGTVRPVAVAIWTILYSIAE